jgi:DNA-binding MarR family transcriptional regulator
MPPPDSYHAVLTLVRVAGLLRKAADRFFKDFGLTQSQFNVLMVLRDSPQGCSQTNISHRLLVQAANTTVVLRRLEARGLLVREPDPNDDRARVVRMTPKGRKLLARVEPLYRRQVEALMSEHSPRALAQFVNRLEALQKATESIDAGVA